jgi:hypothetical protein
MDSLKNKNMLVSFVNGFEGFLGVLGVLLGSSAYAFEPVQLNNRFDLEEVKWIKEAGNASLKGKAFLKLENGEYKGCAGFNIELLPITQYSSERINKTYGNNQQGQILLKDNPPKFTPDAKEYHDMVIKTQCNDSNEFSFSQIKPGDYYGGAVMKRVHIKEKMSSDILLKN